MKNKRGLTKKEKEKLKKDIDSLIEKGYFSDRERDLWLQRKRELDNPPYIPLHPPLSNKRDKDIK